MKIATSTLPTVSAAKTDQLNKSSSRSIEQEKARLKDATKQFEAFFNYYMLKTMRETIPKSGLEDDLPLGGSNGQEQFSDMFDMEISKAGTGGKRSISDILYRSLEKLVEAKYNSDKPTPHTTTSTSAANPAATTATSSKDALPKMISLQRSKVQLKSLQPKAIEIQQPAGTAIPITPKKELSPHRSDAAIPVMERYAEHIDAAAKETKLDSTLIASVIQAESGGNANAVSHAGAKGLMQLADTTAQDYGVQNVFDPAENIRAGSRFLKTLVDKYQDVKLALAAYNAGPGNVDKFGGVPPFKETQDYVTRVTNYVKHTQLASVAAKGSEHSSDNSQ